MSLTVTLFQNRFCSTVFGLAGFVRTSCALRNSSACFRFLATLSSASDGAGLGGSGGGPGVVGCGRGVADLEDDVWRHW